MPVYLKDNVKGRYEVILYRKGRRSKWVVYGTREDALTFEARKRTELRAPEAVPRAGLRFSELCAHHYRPFAELRLGKATWYQRQFQLVTLVEHFGRLRLTEIRESHVDNFVQWRREQVAVRPIEYARNGKSVGYSRPARTRPVSNTTINNELRVLSAVLNFARERKFPTVPLKVRTLAEAERRPKAWRPDELARLLRVCGEVDAQLLPMLLFLANTGCRKAEARHLTWDNVDFARGEIRVWPCEEWKPKNGRPREVPISTDLAPVLDGLKRYGAHVFVSRLHEPFSAFPMGRFTHVVRAAKLVGGPHRLRHTFASMFLARQPDLGLLSVILGHSDEAVTRLYTHMLPDRLARARNVVSVGAGGK